MGPAALMQGHNTGAGAWPCKAKVHCKNVHQAPWRSRRHGRCLHMRRLAATADHHHHHQQQQQQHRGHVLVLPAFYTDAQRYSPLVEHLRGLGFNAALAPVRWSNWTPTLGGRSMRPILDRYEYALTQLLHGYQVTQEGGWEVPLPAQAKHTDWVQEMRDASKGAHPPLPHTGPGWSSSEKAAIVASSASGWIARILLGTQGHAYGGRVYHGAERVHTLVTLGTPHTSDEPVTRRNIGWVNKHYPGCAEEGVRYVTVGSKLVQGRVWLGGRVQDLAYQSYALCCGDGSVWGDGVTPLCCALGLDGAQQVVLEGAEHVPISDKPWYGTPGPFLDAWLPWLEDPSRPGEPGNAEHNLAQAAPAT